MADILQAFIRMKFRGLAQRRMERTCRFKWAAALLEVRISMSYVTLTDIAGIFLEALAVLKKNQHLLE